MAPVLAFWAAALLTGALALPLAFAIFRRFPDAGAGLSFALGLLLTGYAYFILRTFSILPGGRGGAVIALLLLGLASAATTGRDRRARATLERALPGIIAAAGLFSMAFFGFVIFRSYQPQIDGTEQPMDLMYLNASINSPTYPPHDPWLSGERASYYYFGYVQTGVLTSVSGVRAEEGYNLGLAFTFAAAAAGVASVATALARWTLGARARRWTVAAGGLGVVLLLGVGSLAGIFEVAAAHEEYNKGLYDAFGVDWLLPCAAGQTTDCYHATGAARTTAWYPTEFWFWFRDTRALSSHGVTNYDAITEFPIFSFVLGDLHPHVMSLPMVLLAIAIAAALWRGRGPLSLDTLRRRPALGVLLAIAFGGLAFENAWDVITFTTLLAVAVVARNARYRDWGILYSTAGFLVPVGALAIALYLPWYRDFSSQASGFAPYIRAGTTPAQALLQFGPLLAAGLMSLAWAWRGASLRLVADSLVKTAALPVAPFFVWLLFTRFRGELSQAADARGAGGWWTLIFYGLATWLLAGAALTLARRRRHAAAVPALAALATLLLYGAELFVIEDIFSGSAPRMNTIFKLSYQAWILLSVGGAVGLIAALRAARFGRTPAGWLAVPALALVAGGLVYGPAAIANRIGDSSGETTIDGLASVAKRDPDDYAVTKWIGAHTPGDAVIVEATGRTWRRGQDGRPQIVDPGVDYGPGGRISGRTGRETVIGWRDHEVQWRGTDDATRTELARRQDLVDAIYLAPDARTAVERMQEAGARYLVVSTLELNRYPPDAMPHFEQAMDLVFQSGQARVYALPVNQVTRTS